ncbi:MAG TPA: TIGR04222 domain-containing membrane protein [Nevskiaceae bacterium]|nr:TIGR04222 domain-containing membrane protein [Nevskiaceae bacterium]
MDAIRNHLGPGGIDLAAQLVRKLDWSRAFADDAVEEYARFCWLAQHAGHAVAPSEEVDQVWHLHLQHTRDYWEVFCPRCLGGPFHHQPASADREHRRRLRDDYAETLASYQRHFGAPAEAFWPPLARRFDAPQRFRLVDLHTSRIVARRARPRWRIAALVATVLGLGIVSEALALPANPLDWDGPTFLKLFLALAAAAVAFGLVARRVMRRTERYAGPTLTPSELAYLEGGPARVFDAAVMDLMARRVVRWDGSGDGLVVDNASAPLPMPLDSLVRRIRDTPKITDLLKGMPELTAPIRDRLVERQLLFADSLLSRDTLLPMVPIALVELLGAAKVAVGVSRDRPVAFLVILMIVLAVIALVLLAKRPRRTTGADTVIKATKTQYAAAMRAPRTQDMAIAVALGGTAVLAGTAYAAWDTARRPPPSTSDSSGSSSDSSSDSGGGGDGGGGGGCGGCGGGGGGD